MLYIGYLIIVNGHLILQGVRRLIPHLRVCYANNAGYTTPTPALDLTTSLRGDFVFSTMVTLVWGRGGSFNGCQPF